MLGALRLGDDHLSADQLDAIFGLEYAQVDEPVVLDTRPPTGSSFAGKHAPNRIGASAIASMSTNRDTSRCRSTDRFGGPHPVRQRGREADRVRWSALLGRLGACRNELLCMWPAVARMGAFRVRAPAPRV